MMETYQFTGNHLLCLKFVLIRGMRQKRYDSVEKMLDLLDVVKRIGPKFPLDAMFLDPHDRKKKINLTIYSRMGWWHDLSLCRLSILQEIHDFRHRLNCNFLLKSLIGFSSSSSITTMCFSTTRTCSLWLRQPWVFSLCPPTFSTTSIENKFSDVIFSTSTCKWELMNWLRRENICLEVSRWRNGYGSVPTFKRLWWDATDSLSRMKLLTSLTQNFFFKTSSEDTLMILLKSHLLLETQESDFEKRGLKEIKFNLNYLHHINFIFLALL